MTVLLVEDVRLGPTTGLSFKLVGENYSELESLQNKILAAVRSPFVEVQQILQITGQGEEIQAVATAEVKQTQRRNRKPKEEEQKAPDSAAEAYSEGLVGDPSVEVVTRAREMGLPDPVTGTPDAVIEPKDWQVTETVTAEPEVDDSPEPRQMPKSATASLKKAVAVNPADFEECKKRRDIIRMFQKKGVTQLDDMVAVCENLKDDVKMLGLLKDIPPAIKAAYEACRAEDGAR